MRTITEGQTLPYTVDLSSINVIDDNGQIWVPDETMVDVLITSSDPDILMLYEGGTNGNFLANAPGVATIEFSVWYEGKMVAADSKTFIVLAEGQNNAIQELCVKVHNGDTTSTSEHKNNLV